MESFAGVVRVAQNRDHKTYREMRSFVVNFVLDTMKP